VLTSEHRCFHCNSFEKITHHNFHENRICCNIGNILQCFVEASILKTPSKRFSPFPVIDVQTFIKFVGGWVPSAQTPNFFHLEKKVRVGGSPSLRIPPLQGSSALKSRPLEKRRTKQRNIVVEDKSRRTFCVFGFHNLVRSTHFRW